MRFQLKIVQEFLFKGFGSKTARVFGSRVSKNQGFFVQGFEKLQGFLVGFEKLLGFLVQGFEKNARVTGSRV